MGEGADQPPAAVHAQVATGPQGGCPDVRDEDGILGGGGVDRRREDLRVDRAAVAVRARERVHARARAAVVVAHAIEVAGVAAAPQTRQQRVDGVLHGADDGHVDLDATADVLTADVDLHDACLRREERPVREVRPEHEQSVAVFHRPVARREPEQAGHADVVGVVVLDELLTAHRVDHGCGERIRDLDDLVVRALAACAREDRDAPGRVQQLCGVTERPLVRRDLRPRPPDRRRARRGIGVVQEDLARDHDDGDAAPLERVADRDVEDTRQLLRDADELAVDAAFAEQLLRVGLLEVRPADLLSWDVRGDREHGHPAAVRVEEPVDEMEVARAAACGADGQLAGHAGVAGSGEGGGLLVPDVHPIDASVAAQRVGQTVEGVAGQPVDAPDAAGLQRRDDGVGRRQGRARSVASARKAPAVAVPNTRCALRSFPRVSRSYSQIGR